MNFRFSFVWDTRNCMFHFFFFFLIFFYVFFLSRYVDRFFRCFLFGQRQKFIRNIRNIRISWLITSLHAWTTIRGRFQFQTTRFVYPLSWADVHLSISSLHMFVSFTNTTWFVIEEIDVNSTKFWTVILI